MSAFGKSRFLVPCRRTGDFWWFGQFSLVAYNPTRWNYYLSLSSLQYSYFLPRVPCRIAFLCPSCLYLSALLRNGLHMRHEWHMCWAQEMTTWSSSLNSSTCFLLNSMCNITVRCIFQLNHSTRSCIFSMVQVGELGPPIGSDLVSWSGSFLNPRLDTSGHEAKPPKTL